MTESTKNAASLSFATQIFTKAINLGLSILFVRLIPASTVGTFTLLIASAQLVCSLGRVGTNYSYAVLLPQQRKEEDRLQLTVTYVWFGLTSSLIVSGITLSQLISPIEKNGITHYHALFFFCAALVYLLSDSFSETIWSIHLALGRFKSVFMRDVWVALGKGLLPLAGALWLGPVGVATGLGLISVFNCFVANTLLQRQKTGLKIFSRPSPSSVYLLRQLLLKGLPFFSVPLVNNLILWPILLNVVSSSGIDKLDDLRVAQISAQVIGIISTSLIPVLLVKSSYHTESNQYIHQKAFQACWVSSIVIYGLYALIDQTLLPLIFGNRAGDGSIEISRVLVAAAAVQGLSQIPMQRPLPTSTLVRLAILQVGSLIVAAFIATSIFSPANHGLLAYASINLLSPLITVMSLPLILGQSLVADERTSWLQVIISIALLSTCFLINGNIFQTGFLFASIGITVYLNREFIYDLRLLR